MKRDLVRDGYDHVALQYLNNRDRLKSGRYIQKFLRYLPKNSRILDLGCGAGVPVDDVFIKAGHSLIGIDISLEQIKLARKYCPRGEYLVQDMDNLSEGEYEVEAVISFYAIFHLERENQGRLLKKMASFLKKGGLLLITMGDREFEGMHELHGTRMWSSQYGTSKNRKLIESSGFKIFFEELDRTGGERHQIIMAEKL